MLRLFPVSLLLCFAVVLAACGGAAPAAEAPAEEAAPAEAPAAEAPAAEALAEEAPAADDSDLTATKQAVVETYADIVFASYEDSYTTAVTLQEALNAFVADPSDATLQTARDAWLAAQEPYGQTEVYRFYGGPIDDEDGPEGLINSWPLDEAFVDYVEGAPDAGIINNVAEYPAITTDLLIELNQVDSEESVTTGYHAIEFLLWGQDTSADTSGTRPYTDYLPADAGGTAANPERRAAYLTAAADLLVQHLAEMKDAWDPAVADNYRAEWLALDPDDALQKMLTGMGVLSKSELAGERMFTAYDNQDQEDEHSCFSDNTHRDIITNTQGIRNVYVGSYTRLDGSEVSGTGLDAVVATLDPELNERVLALSDESLTQVNALSVPFDQAIIEAEQRPQVLDAVYVLQDQGDSFAEVAQTLGLTINTALPE